MRRLIGVEVENTPNEIGVRIRGFQEKLPAIDSVLRQNDLILKVNNVDIKNTFQFIQLIKESEINKKIKFHYVKSQNINDDFEFNNSNIKTLSLTPKKIKYIFELRLSYFPKEDLYLEYLYDHKSKEL